MIPTFLSTTRQATAREQMMQMDVDGDVLIAQKTDNRKQEHKQEQQMERTRSTTLSNHVIFTGLWEHACAPRLLFF